MDKAQHTPGPWHVKPHNYPIGDTGDYDGCYLVIAEGCKHPVVEVWGDNDKDEANARLIAAAPELLEALIALRTANGANDFNGWHADFDEAIFKARAAIAKATGQS